MSAFRMQISQDVLTKTRHVISRRVGVIGKKRSLWRVTSSSAASRLHTFERTHPPDTMAEESETFAFQAEINQLLSLIINVRRPNPAPRFPAKTIRGATIAPSTRHSRRRSKIRPAHAPQCSKLTPISLFPAADLLLQ